MGEFAIGGDAEFQAGELRGVQIDRDDPRGGPCEEGERVIAGGALRYCSRARGAAKRRGGGRTGKSNTFISRVLRSSAPRKSAHKSKVS